MRNLFQYEGHQSVYKLKLPTDEPEVLGGILNWMYHQQLEVTEETLAAWIKTADFLLIQPLVDDLNKLLLEKLSPQSCLRLWKASVDQSAWVMKETIEHYMVKNHSEVVASQAYKGLTMDESHIVLTSMTEYLHQFLRSRKNLKNYSFIATVWDFAVCHGQKDLIELSIKSFVRVRHTMEFNHLPTNRKHQIIECVIPILERNITPGNVIEMWWTAFNMTFYDGVTWHMKEQRDRFGLVCKEYIRDNCEKIPLSQSMMDTCAEEGILQLVPEENRQQMVDLFYKMKEEGQENIPEDSWLNEPPFFDYTESDESSDDDVS